jgi:hypothetical protein
LSLGVKSEAELRSRLEVTRVENLTPEQMLEEGLTLVESILRSEPHLRQMALERVQRQALLYAAADH